MAFRDGLGERRLTKDGTGASVEALCLRRELTAAPSFEFALRERVTRLTPFRHAYYGRVRGIERATEFDNALAVMSDATPGVRLSALLDTAHERRLPVSLDVALCLIRQLAPAVAILHETARDASHGAIGPERLIVTPNGRLVIVEYVLGSALEQLLFTRERYWSELRVALPRVAGLPRFDHLADVTQIGVVALSLILGRTLRDDEYPTRIGEVVAAAMATNAHGEQQPLTPSLRSWLQRALQLDSRGSFPSAIEARAEFERVISDSGSDASPESLDTFLTRYHAHETPIAPSAAAPKPLSPLPIAPKNPSSRPPASSAVTGQPVAAPPVTAAAATLPMVSSAASESVVAPAAVAPVPPHAVPPFDSKPFVQKTPAAWSTPSSDSRSTAAKETWSETSASDTSVSAIDPPGPRNVAAAGLPAHHAGGRFVKVAAAAVIGVVLLGGGALVGAKRFLADEPAPSATGTLTVTTNPAGAEAFIDGVRRGVTPITLQLLAGSHRVELRAHGEPRTIPVTIAPGQQVAQYVDLPNAPAPVPQKIEAAPEPSPAVERPATVPAPNAPGWLAVNGKIEVQIFEDAHLLGTSKIERIMVPAGRHDLELVNELIGYRATRTVSVAPGKVTTLAVDVPKGAMAINALPWAEVWMDGAKIGETPIGNFAVPVGSHDVVFRHPDLGEQRETVLVTLKNPVRLSVDMRKP